MKTVFKSFIVLSLLINNLVFAQIDSTQAKAIEDLIKATELSRGGLRRAYGNANTS